MTPELLSYLCDPCTGETLDLRNATYGNNEQIVSGELVSPSGRIFAIRDGVPRFAEPASQDSVASFGDEWNYFNFTDFKINWLKHTVASTFGSPEAFEGKLIVDCGGGSGAQSKWFAEYGARHVIMLELSHSVDDVARRNLAGLSNVDMVQCSIDKPPLRAGSIDGIVYCHNVIQHTASVEETATALFALVAAGGEFVFNCYPRNDATPLRWIRQHIVQASLRAVLSRLPFNAILSYARIMGLLRTLPGGVLLEKSGACLTGDVPVVEGEDAEKHLERVRKATTLNTFDAYGSHKYQHSRSDAEIRHLVEALQPDPTKVKNAEAYFAKPPPIGCALRLLA